jgi:hypothetical protein
VVAEPDVLREHPDQVQAATLLGAGVRHRRPQALLVVSVTVVDHVDDAGGLLDADGHPVLVGVGRVPHDVGARLRQGQFDVVADVLHHADRVQRGPDDAAADRDAGVVPG